MRKNNSSAKLTPHAVFSSNNTARSAATGSLAASPQSKAKTNDFHSTHGKKIIKMTAEEALKHLQAAAGSQGVNKFIRLQEFREQAFSEFREKFSKAFEKHDQLWLKARLTPQELCRDIMLLCKSIENNQIDGASYDMICITERVLREKSNVPNDSLVLEANTNDDCDIDKNLADDLSKLKSENDELKKQIAKLMSEFKKLNEVIAQLTSQLDSAKNQQKQCVQVKKKQHVQSHYPVSQKTGKSYSLVTGTKQDCEIKAVAKPPKKFYYYVGRLDKACDSVKLKNYVEEFLSDGTCEVEELNVAKHAYFKSFKVTIDQNMHHEFLDSNNWFENVVIRRFYMKRSSNLVEK